jgi:hypothetical protein
VSEDKEAEPPFRPTGEPFGTADDLLDRRLTQALAHPVRVQILAMANHRECSPAMFAKEHGYVVGNVSYHFKKLERLGCLELVNTRPVRGSTEHFYRGTRRALFGPIEWAELVPKSVKAGVAGAALIDYIRVAQKAIEGGTLDSDNDVYVLWRATRLDQEGWEAMGRIFESARQQLDDVMEEAGKRLAASGELGISTTFALMQFEMPEIKPVEP